MSCSSAATSTPVGPPPTTTNDSSFCLSYKARRAVRAEAGWTTPASTACIPASQKLHAELIATTTGLARKTTYGICMHAFSACELVREQKFLTSNLLQTIFYHLQVCLKGMGLSNMFTSVGHADVMASWITGVLEPHKSGKTTTAGS